MLLGPALSHVCAHEAFRPAVDPAGVIFSVVEGKDVYDLYQHFDFEDALDYEPDYPRPDVAAAGADAGVPGGPVPADQPDPGPPTSPGSPAQATTKQPGDRGGQAFPGA